MERLNFQVIEKKWQSTFEKEKLFHNKDSKKFYCLEMFPYPSVKSRTCKKLYYWRCHSQVQVYEWI